MYNIHPLKPIISAVNLKGIWPRRVPKARAVHAAGGGGAAGLFVVVVVVGNLDEAAASAASMQFTALYYIYHIMTNGF